MLRESNEIFICITQYESSTKYSCVLHNTRVKLNILCIIQCESQTKYSCELHNMRVILNTPEY